MKINWHEDFIFQLASVVRPALYVELGIQYCANFNRIIDYAERLIGVDIYADAKKHMSPSPKVQFSHGTTHDFVTDLRLHPQQIDMLFIDADHSDFPRINDL